MRKKNFVIVAVIIFVITIVVVMRYITLNNRTVAPVIPNEATENWRLVGTNAFTLSLPPGWKFNATPGIDSYVGEFVGDGVTLRFDYGRYAHSLADDNDLNYKITHETFDDHKGELVVSVIEGSGTTGVYFEGLGDNKIDRLQISGENLTASQQDVALEIFRTLQFTK